MRGLKPTAHDDMKRILRFSIFLAAVSVACHAPSATITKGYTFSTNEQVTAAKLHTLVDSATVSAITGSDITDGSIVAVDLGASSVITAKIQDGAVTAGKLGALAVETAKIATNAVGGTQLATNLDLSGKTFTWPTNQIPSYAISGTNAGPGTAGQVPILNAGGFIASSLLAGLSTVVTTNITGAVGNVGANTWAEAGRITTTATTGAVVIVAQAATKNAAGAYTHLRIRDVSTNVEAVASFYTADTWLVQQVTLNDVLTGSAKTYVFESAANGGGLLLTNRVAAPPVANAMFIKAIQLK